MAIRKFRRIEDAEMPSVVGSAGQNLRSAIELSEFCLRLRPMTPPRGVRRFASIEDAQSHRLRWETDALTT